VRLCHVVGDSRFGGGSKIITRLARAGLDAGHDVEVLATNPDFIAYLDSHDVRCVDLDCIWRPVRPHKDLKGLFTLYRHLRRSRYDLVHTHTSKAGFVGRLAARVAGVPAIVHTVHGFSFHQGTGTVPLRFFSLLERAAACWCHRLVTVSLFHREWALSLGIGSPDKLRAIPNGIPDPDEVDEAARHRIREEFGVENDGVLVLSMGRLVEGKGLEDLVRAIALLRASGRSNIRIALPGTGPLAETLERLVAESQLDGVIVLPGFRADVSALLSAADLVVLPSYREGMSISLLEAMAAGKPIVTSDIDSNLEATGNGETAVIVPCGQPERLADAIDRMLADPMRASELGRRARARWETHYTEDRMIADYLDLYREMSS